MLYRAPIAGLMMLTCLLGGQTSDGQEGAAEQAKGKKTKAGAPAKIEVRIFTLHDSDAAEMVKTLKAIFQGDNANKFRIVVHESSNSLVVCGDAQGLKTVGAIVGRLEAAMRARKAETEVKPQRDAKPAAAKRQVALAQADVDMWEERVNWAQRMHQKGYLSQQQLTHDKARRARAKIELGNAEMKLKALEADQE